jgi:hypothetical protein
MRSLITKNQDADCVGGCATAKHYGSLGGGADEYRFIEKHQTMGYREKMENCKPHSNIYFGLQLPSWQV